jgi:hypothetical protein
MQKRNYGAEESCGRQRRDEQGGDSSRSTQHPIDHSALLFAAPISSVGSNHHNKKQKQSPRYDTHQDTDQISGQSVHAKNVNINAADVFLAADDRALWCCDTEEKLAVITQAVFRLL